MLKISFYIIGLFLFSICKNVNAQTSIRNFNLQQYQQSIKVSFIIATNQYCTGYQIQRTADINGEYSVIYDYPSICSDVIEPKSVIYYDENPIKNVISYYRIYVAPSAYSAILPITYHEAPELGYILYSNPTNATFKIKVNSPYAVSEVYNNTGRKLLVFTADAAGMIHENIEQLPDGIYYFLIRTTDNLLIKGKLIKTN